MKFGVCTLPSKFHVGWCIDVKLMVYNIFMVKNHYNRNFASIFAAYCQIPCSVLNDLRINNELIVNMN